MYSKIYFWNTTMADTTQLNLRIPINLKIKAQEKAEKIWTNLNFLVKMFLSKFTISDSAVTIKQDIHIEKIFDQWMIEYFMSPEGKRRTKKINNMLEELIKDEDKYLV